MLHNFYNNTVATPRRAAPTERRKAPWGEKAAPAACCPTRMPRWFCGREPAWKFFSAPLMESRCYFTSTISKDSLEEVGLQVWDTEGECSCTLAPPPPAPPPQRIYFCGRPGALPQSPLPPEYPAWAARIAPALSSPAQAPTESCKAAMACATLAVSSHAFQAGTLHLPPAGACPPALPWADPPPPPPLPAPGRGLALFRLPSLAAGMLLLQHHPAPRCHAARRQRLP
jgi:hypothetical protein